MLNDKISLFMGYKFENFDKLLKQKLKLWIKLYENCVFAMQLSSMAASSVKQKVGRSEQSSKGSEGLFRLFISMPVTLKIHVNTVKAAGNP